MKFGKVNPICAIIKCYMIVNEHITTSDVYLILLKLEQDAKWLLCYILYILLDRLSWYFWRREAIDINLRKILVMCYVLLYLCSKFGQFSFFNNIFRDAIHQKIVWFIQEEAHSLFHIQQHLNGDCVTSFGWNDSFFFMFTCFSSFFITCNNAIKGCLLRAYFDYDNDPVF